MRLDIALLVVSLIVAAVAAAAETSLTGVSELRMRTLAEEGSRRARRVVRLRADKQAFLGTILLLNNVALIVAAQATTLLFGGSVPEVLVTFVLSFVAYEFCELVPKSLALAYPEATALTLAPLVSVSARLVRWVVTAASWLARLLVRGLSRARNVSGPFVTEQDVKMIVTVGEEVGAVEPEERQMIHGVLELTDKVAREVMVPRVDLVAVDVEDGLDEMVQLVIATGHSRIPVFEGNVDNIVGIVYAKDVLRHRGAAAPPSLRELAREAYFTPESKRAGELLIEMRQNRKHMAVVVDEYGGTAGLCTIEDLLEEIVGEIRDEYDIAETEEIEFLSDREVLMSARVPLDDVDQLLHLELDTDEIEADSIGGLVYERLGEVPKVGATLRLGEMTLTVDSVRRQSIRTVRIESPHPFLLDRHAREEHEAELAARRGEARGPEGDESVSPGAAGTQASPPRGAGEGSADPL